MILSIALATRPNVSIFNQIIKLQNETANPKISQILSRYLIRIIPELMQLRTDEGHDGKIRKRASQYHQTQHLVLAPVSEFISYGL
jgi:hypothetical protein